jgi:HSP20 family protein
MATLVRWEPFRELASLQNEMSRLLNAFEGNGRTLQNWVPALDVWETDEDVVYAFDLPGIPKDAIDIEFDEGALTVSAKRERKHEVKEDNFYRYERRFGTFQRTVGLPQGVDESAIRAEFDDGVLEIHVQKPQQAKPRRIEIGGMSQPTIEGSATPAE